MASFQVLKDLRLAISDQPVLVFNETTSDGENASWRLTNSPVQIASESVFISGLLYQTQTHPSSADLDSAIAEDGYQLNLGAQSASFAAGEYITLDQSPDPYKYRIESISGGILTLNREVPQIYPVGTNVDRITHTYSIDYEAGVIYFFTAWVTGTPLLVKYKYTRHSDKTLNHILDMAERDVGRDIGAVVDEGNPDQMTLVLLRAKISMLKKEITAGASSSIKIKQGSTSLDLTGSNSARANQVNGEEAIYQEALLRYLHNAEDLIVGEAVVGREGYIQA